jgi:protein-disulfide isomerase
MKKLIPMIAAALVGAGAYYIFVMDRGPETVAAVDVELSQPVADNTDSAAAVDTSGIQEMAIGNPDAPVTVIEYASYTCPHCATFHGGVFKELKKDYIDTGKINFVYREVYFDRYGLWASLIARCAGPEKFFGVSDLLYAGQPTWSRAGEPAAIVGELRKIGRLAGMSEETLGACLENGDKAQALVAWYQENAEADGVRSTPSFVINGTTYNNMSYAEMSKLIDEAAE